MEQQRLFDPGERSTALSVRQFMDRATWHATWKPDWLETVRGADRPFHHGTAQAAADRVQLGVNSPRSRSTTTHFYPVVADEVSDDTFTDNQANLGAEDYVARNAGEAAISVQSHPEKLLREGVTVPYTNEAEDVGSTSYVSTPSSVRTLEETTNYHDLPAGRRGNFITGTDVLRQGVRNRGNRFDTYRQPTLDRANHWGAY